MVEPVELVDPPCIVVSLPLVLPPVADGVVLRLAGGLPSVGGALGFGALLLGGACWATTGRLSAAHSASAVVVTIRFIVGSID
jgi:ABC-type molybdate transport system permease subunit